MNKTVNLLCYLNVYFFTINGLCFVDWIFFCIALKINIQHTVTTH